MGPVMRTHRLGHRREGIHLGGVLRPMGHREVVVRRQPGDAHAAECAEIALRAAELIDERAHFVEVAGRL